MPEIQGGRWDNFLARCFPVKGRPVAPQLAPELVPIVVAQPNEPELYALRGEKLWHGFGFRQATAGQFSGASLFNPADSGMLVIVQCIWIGNDQVAARQYNLYGPGTGAITFDTAGTATTTPRDSRYRGESIVAQLTAGSIGVIPGTSVGEFRHPANDQVRYDIPWILSPNNRITVFGDVQNNEVEVIFEWRERPAERSELTL
jgi:hypothetical protein